jgi:hypothetical protein
MFSWAGSVGTSTAGNTPVNSMKVDPSGNAYIIGNFAGVLDMDPSAGIYNIASYNMAQNIFVAKYGPAGNLIWAKKIGSIQGTESGEGITIDNLGNIIICGTFGSSTDFDPGPGTFSMTPTGNGIFFEKLDASGNFIWAKQISNIGGGKSIYSVATDANSNVFIGGAFAGTLDFDPSPAVSIYTASGYNAYLAKYDLNGNYIWTDLLDGPASSSIKTIKCDNLGSVFVGGDYISTIDFDPSPGVYTLTTGGSSNQFFARYSSSGALIWAKPLSGNSNSSLSEVALGPNKDIGITGAFNGTVDFDPSIGVANQVCNNNSYADIYIARYDSLGNYIWARRTGNGGSNCGTSLIITNTGDFFASGRFNYLTTDFDPGPGIANLNLVGGTDGYIVKYDSGGNYVWAGGFGSGGSESTCNISLDNSGNLVIAGYFQSICDFDFSPSTYTLNANPFPGPISFFLARYTPSGGIVNAIAPQNADETNDQGMCIRKDAVGNIYVCGAVGGFVDFDFSPGNTSIQGQGLNDAFVAKYSPAGSLLWVKTLGGPGEEWANTLAIDNNGNCYIAGYFSSTCNINPPAGPTVAAIGSYDAFLVKYNPSGSLLWYKTWNSSVGSWAQCESMVTNSLNEVYVAGRFTGTVDLDPSPSVFSFISNGFDDIFCSKFDQNGNFITGTAAGSNDEDMPSALAVDKNDRVLMTGFFSGYIDFDPSLWVTSLGGISNRDIFVAKYDKDLDIMWAKEIGGVNDDEGYDIAVDPSNNYLLTGCYSSNIDFNLGPGFNIVVNNSGSQDAFYAKYDSSFNYIWAKGFGSPGPDYGTCIASDLNSNVYLQGMFTQTVNFMQVPSIYSSGSGDFYVGKSDPSGNLVWCKGIGGSGYDVGMSLALDYTAGTIYSTGLFNALADFDPSPQTYNLISNGADDIFILKLRECQTPTISVASQSNVSCNGGNNGYISINALGDISFTYSWTPTGNQTATLSNAVAGIYSCNVTSSCGLSGLFTVNISQPAPLTLSLTSQSNGSVCSGNTVSILSFTNGGVAPVTYSWNNGAITSSIAVSPTINTNYMLQVLDANNCMTSGTLGINVFSSPVLSVTASPATICPGTSATLTANGATTYTWNNYFLTPTLGVTPMVNTTYTVAGSNANCTSVKTITVFIFPQSSVGISSSSPTLCAGDAATLTATGAVSYTWTAGSYVSTIAITPTTSTSFIVTGQDINGCLKTVGYWQYVVICTGMPANTLNNNLLIFPNPAPGEFYLSGLLADKTNAEVYNIEGQKIISLTIEKGTNKIILDNYPNGVYFLRIYNDQVSKTFKLIKE